MFDPQARKSMAQFSDGCGRLLARSGVRPATLTALGLLITICGSLLVASGRLLPGALVIGSGALLDALDGAVARASGRASARGAFLDSVSDRAGETAIWAGLAYFVAGNRQLVVLCVIALGSSMMISYLRSKAEGSGVDAQVGWMTRMERVVLYVAGVGSGLIEPLLWAMVVLTLLTVIQRFRHAWSQLPS